VPLEVLFKKIVAIRDCLRVLIGPCYQHRVGRPGGGGPSRRRF
jgi:hypothetical protein